MSYFVITGKEDCLNCTHAIHAAEHIAKYLPQFSYRCIIKNSEEWPIWLDQLNSVNNWHETKSPVIWKEINIMGGKPRLIGGLGEFWEYCYDYYGFQSRISKEDLEKILADYKLIAKKYEIKQSITNISITGTSNNRMLQFLIVELEQCFSLDEYKNLTIKIYDEIYEKEAEQMNNLLAVLEDIKDFVKFVPQNISFVSTLKKAVENCDLLIVIDDYSRKDDETFEEWFERCRQEMLLLSDDINLYAKRSLKIILSHPGPVCFNASVLMEYCTIIKLTNIVAVTADEGISIISMLADKVGEPVENLWCPVVWGFSGVVSYLSIACTPITAKVIRPYRRSLKTKETTKLPKGIIQYEIRFLENVTKADDELLNEIQEKRDRENEILGEQPILPKIRALCSLLKLWFAKEISDDIISLGICSNGSYGFPVGICFSQAVALNENRVWEPVRNLPIRSTTADKIASISMEIENLLKKFGLGSENRSFNVKY